MDDFQEYNMTEEQRIQMALEKEAKAKKGMKQVKTFFIVVLAAFCIVAIFALIVEECETSVQKPVIYIYPEQTTEVSVKLDFNGELTTTYPKYEDGWKVTAEPEGTLCDRDGKLYSYLYWEGETKTDFDMSEGFCVKGSETAEFLEKALDTLGLNRREANEFIVYWLPQMEKNEYNVISFQTEAYTDSAVLDIEPAPDTLIRVFMTWYGSKKPVELPEQMLNSPERTGFTVVEWGGSELAG